MGALDTRVDRNRWPHHQVQSSRFFTGSFGPPKGPAVADVGGITYSTPWIECSHGQRLDNDISRQEHTAAAGAMGPAECMGSCPIVELSRSLSTCPALHFMHKVELERHGTGSQGAATRPKSSRLKRDSASHARAHMYNMMRKMPCIYGCGAKAFARDILSCHISPRDMGQGSASHIAQINEGRHAAGEEEATTPEC